MVCSLGSFLGLTGTTFLNFEKEGLGVGWPAQATDMDKLKALHEELKSKI